MSGWIKLHRQILEWEWYSDNNAFRVFLHLMLKANHKEKRFKGIELQKGCVVTSRDILAIETGLSVRQVRTALDKLKSTNELTIKTNTQGTIIQIVNYDKYQVETNEATNERPTNDQQTTTNKNVKNKEEKNIYRRFAHLSISKDELETLKINWTEEQINEILDQIENYAKNKQYKSLYLTAQNWLKKSYPIKKDEPFKFPWQ
jgi:hypothetical protein